MLRPLKDLGFAISGYHSIDCSTIHQTDEWLQFCNLIADDSDVKAQVKPHYEALAHLLYKHIESKR